jgi:hypothetical protein
MACRVLKKERQSMKDCRYEYYFFFSNRRTFGTTARNARANSNRCSVESWMFTVSITNFIVKLVKTLNFPSTPFVLRMLVGGWLFHRLRCPAL